MDESLLPGLSLKDKEALIQKNGQFIEAQDYYSFFVLVYLLGNDHIKLLYDFTGLLVSIECQDETHGENFLSHELESSL